MEHASYLQSLRLRTSQFLTWMIGSTQTQQQFYQGDRHQYDGYIRSSDDPDHSRARQFFATDTGSSLRERFQNFLGGSSSHAESPDRQRHVIEAQQWQQREWQRRGGWGHGR